jgi:hypothetical protein
MTQMRAVVRDRPCTICSISGDAGGGSAASAAVLGAHPRANVAMGSPAPRTGADVVQRERDGLRGAASARSCASRRKRSISRTYS